MVKINDQIVLAPHGAAAAADSIIKDENLKKVPARMDKFKNKDYDTVAAKEIKRRFPELSYVEGFVRQKNGLTLFLEIRLAMIQSTISGGRLGTNVLGALRMKWSQINSPESLLRVKNPSDAVPATLITALDTATSTNTRLRTSQPLLSWLSCVSTQPSQKAMIGLFRHSLSKHPSCRHLNVCIHLMKMVARLQLHFVYPEECKCMVEHWDAALCCWLRQLQIAGLKDSAFMDQNVEVVGLAVNPADVLQVARADDVSSVAEELKSLCCSSAHGARVYGSQLGMLAQSSYLLDLYEIMATEFAETIDQSQLDSAFHRAQTSAMKWEYDLRCRGKNPSPHISTECRCLCRFQMPIQLQEQ